MALCGPAKFSTCGCIRPQHLHGVMHTICEIYQQDCGTEYIITHMFYHQSHKTHRLQSIKEKNYV